MYFTFEDDGLRIEFSTIDDDTKIEVRIISVFSNDDPIVTTMTRTNAIRFYGMLSTFVENIEDK